MSTLCDASNWLTYFPDRMDVRRPIWFVRDALEVDALRESGNAVSLAVGADFEDFRRCEDFFSAFPAVFLALGDPEERSAVAEALAEYAPAVPMLLPAENAFRGRKTVREVLGNGEQKAVDRLMIGAVGRPAAGLLDLSAVERLEEPPAVLSGFPELDQTIGGFYAGELSVWTGKRGGGKSTLLGQLLLSALDQGLPVCSYSGELPAWRFKHWVCLQAAGPEYVTKQVDRASRKTFFSVPPQIQKQLDAWWQGRFFLYDNRLAQDEDAVLRMFEFAARRYGCCCFLVDNLMSLRFTTSADRDFYRTQSAFTGRLVEFAKRNEVHVHLIAHPRKTESGRALESDDIGGSGDISNRADNVFSLTRLSDSDAAEKGFQTVLRTLKNRSFGALPSIGLNFEPRSRRFFKSGTGRPDWRYSWESCGEQGFIEMPQGERTPFDGEDT